LDHDTVSACILDRWSGQIGDPHLMGWLTVVLYALVAVAAALVLRQPGAVRGRARAFWWLVALAMAFLAVNKQIDLQSALTALGRCIALRDGWYDTRGPFQRMVLAGLGAGALGILALGLYALRRDLRRNLAALVGLAFVAGFVMLRAVGYHGFDALINTRIEGVRLNWVLEWVGPLLIAANARALWRARDPYSRLQ
jgi:hypothetical protein